MIPRLFAQETRTTRPDLLAAVGQVISRTDPRAVAATLEGMADRSDMTVLLPSIKLPTLVLCGAQDVISPVAEMRTIAEALPAARFVEVAAAGHMAPLEQPAQVNAAIREFLSDA
jgi:pimeloyl-ACP methyl ester carboxylesterase